MRLAIAILGLSSLSAGPRGPVADQVPPASSFRHGLDVLLIRVVADDGDTSSAVIERVFRGRERPGAIPVQWNIVQPNSPDALGHREAHAGDRLIAVGAVAESRFFVQAAYADSEQARQDLATHLPPAERINALQAVSFLFLLATPVLQVVLHFLSKRDRRFLKVNLVLPLIALADYWFYESGIPTYVNIRIDLLLLIPVAALIALLWVIFAVKALNSPRDEPRPAHR